MTKFAELKVGESLSETQYYRVAQIIGKEVDVVNDLGQTITLPDIYVDACLVSASQYSKEEKISKTDAINLLTSSANMAITVNFNKKVDDKIAKQGLYDLYPNKGGKILSEGDFKKKVDASYKSITEGEERTMTGRHTGHINEFGRLSFTDMEITTGHNQRQVDPRELNWMIIKGIKYIVK